MGEYSLIFFGVLLAPVTFLAGGFCLHVAFRPQMHEFADWYFALGGIGSVVLPLLMVFAIYKAEKAECSCFKTKNKPVRLRSFDDDDEVVYSRRPKPPRKPFGGQSIYPSPLES